MCEIKERPPVLNKNLYWKDTFSITTVVRSISIWPVLRDHLCLRTILWLSLEWSLNTGLTTLTDLTQPHFCVCSKPGPGFPMAYIWHGLFFVLFSEIRWEVIVRFVDIGRIVSHHCLSFLYFCWYWQNC